uniref:ABCA8 n=1 Tax=Mesocestoides corti TaxID=53468 RepID=A0A5K3G293_MESCO
MVLGLVTFPRFFETQNQKTPIMESEGTLNPGKWFSLSSYVPQPVLSVNVLMTNIYAYFSTFLEPLGTYLPNVREDLDKICSTASFKIIQMTVKNVISRASLFVIGEI